MTMRIIVGILIGAAGATLAIKGYPSVVRWMFSQGDDEPITLRELARDVGQSIVRG